MIAPSGLPSQASLELAARRGSSSASYTAAEVRAGAFESAAGPVAALLVRGRIVVDEDAFGLKIRKLFVAGVEQEESLAAVDDKHVRVNRVLKLVHWKYQLIQKFMRT